MAYNRKKFFDGYRKTFGSLRQDHVTNLEFLLGKFEASAWFSADVRRAAFALGNLYVETFIPKTKSRFAPVTEFGSKSYFDRYDIKKNPRKARELGNLTPGDGYKYRGRGFCQITGKTNYAKFDIADTPEKALEPDTAFYILERGIRYGIFTGRSLGTYLTADKTDYVNARRVINGLDRAKEIAGYARSFEKILISAATATQDDTFDEPTIDNPVASPEIPQITPPIATGEQPAQVSQVAEQIINTGDNVPPPITEDKTVEGPAKDGATATSTKMVIAGIAVPPVLAGIFKSIGDLMEQGFVNAQEIGSFLMNLLTNNIKWVLGLVGLLIVLQIVKKILKGLSFLFSLITAAIPGWNTVTVVPSETEAKPWWKIW